MSPAAVTTGTLTLSTSHSRRTPIAAMPTVIAMTTAVGMIAPTTEMTMKSPVPIALRTPNASAMPFAMSASTSDSPNDERDRRDEVLPDLGVGATREAERPRGDERAETAAERAEDVAAQPDGRRDEDEQTGQLLERARDGTEDQPGGEPGGRGEKMRDEASADTGWIGADERADPPQEAEAAAALLWTRRFAAHHRHQGMDSIGAEPA